MPRGAHIRAAMDPLNAINRIESELGRLYKYINNTEDEIKIIEFLIKALNGLERSYQKRRVPYISSAVNNTQNSTFQLDLAYQACTDLYKEYFVLADANSDQTTLQAKWQEFVLIFRHLTPMHKQQFGREHNCLKKDWFKLIL